MTGSIPPPSLVRAPRLERECIDLVGIVYLVDGFDLTSLEHACEVVPFGRASGALLNFAPTEITLRRHWPWIAFAANQFEFQTREYEAGRAGALPPSEVKKLLDRIHKNASKLAADLCELQSIANQLEVPGSPEVRGHLRWLDARLSQAIRGLLSCDLDDSHGAFFANHQARMALLGTLARLSASAEDASDRCDPSLLSRGRMQANPAVTGLVRRLAKVWKSMTDREPSANKVNGGEDPEFVVFVRTVANFLREELITRRMVETALT